MSVRHDLQRRMTPSSGHPLDPLELPIRNDDRVVEVDGPLDRHDWARARVEFRAAAAARRPAHRPAGAPRSDAVVRSRGGPPPQVGSPASAEMVLCPASVQNLVGPG